MENVTEMWGRRHGRLIDSRDVDSRDVDSRDVDSRDVDDPTSIVIKSIRTYVDNAHIGLYVDRPWHQ